MRKITGWVLLGVGGFLLMGAILLLTWAPGNAQRTPLNIDSNTYLTGQAQKLNVGTGKLEEYPVRVTNTTKAVPSKSTGKLIVFNQSTCVLQDIDNPPDCAEGTDKRVITQTEVIVGSNRNTAVAVNDIPGMDPIDPPAQGLVVKFPFATKKKTYQVWDGTAGQAVPTEYVGTTKIDGLSVYKFHSNLENADIEIAKGVPGTYSLDKTMWVEPKSGAIIKQDQHDVRKIAEGDKLALDMTIGYDKATVDRNVKDGKSNVRTLNLLLNQAPWGTLVLGLIALGAGSYLTFVGGNGQRRADA